LKIFNTKSIQKNKRQKIKDFCLFILIKKKEHPIAGYSFLIYVSIILFT